MLTGVFSFVQLSRLNKQSIDAFNNRAIANDLLSILRNSAHHTTRRLVVTASVRAPLKLLLKFALMPQEAEPPPAELCRDLTPSSKLLTHLHNLTATLRNRLKDIEISHNHWQSFSPRKICRWVRKDSEVLLLQRLRRFKKRAEMASVASCEIPPLQAAFIIVRHCCCCWEEFSKVLHARDFFSPSSQLGCRWYD